MPTYTFPLPDDYALRPAAVSTRVADWVRMQPLWIAHAAWHRDHCALRDGGKAGAFGITKVTRPRPDGSEEDVTEQELLRHRAQSEREADEVEAMLHTEGTPLTCVFQDASGTTVLVTKVAVPGAGGEIDTSTLTADILNGAESLF